MTAPGQIVILNGAPRSGKTSIARALQADVAGSWINLGVDALMAMLPEHLRPGIGLRPGGERPDLEPVVAELYTALFDSIAAFSRHGFDIVSDLGIHEGHSRPLGIWTMLHERIAGLPLLTVGVLCPIETIMARRNADPRGVFYAAGEVMPDPVARWQAEVHAAHDYDLCIDTSVLSPGQAAAKIAGVLHRDLRYEACSHRRSR